MKTLKLYENDKYLRSCEASIIAIEYEHTSGEKSEQMCLIELDQTVFFPEGGGQSSDTGEIAPFDDSEHAAKVVSVTEQDGRVLHRAALSGISFSVGDMVTATIDWPHRFDNMQRHLGEHIFSGAAYRLYGLINKGFHMGENYIAVDLDYPTSDEEAGITWERGDSTAMASQNIIDTDISVSHEKQKLTWQMAKAIELEANAVIWEDAPVTRSFFDTRDEALSLPVRKPLKIERDISIISVGDLDDPYDQVACCGTHPSSAGQVGLIKLLKIEPNKGMSRVYLEAGKRAFDILRNGFDDLYDIAVSISAGTEDVKPKFEAQMKRASEEHELLREYKQKLISDEAASLCDEIREVGKADKERLISREYDGCTVDDILHIIKIVDKEMSGGLSGGVTLVLISKPESTLILRSDDLDCGRIIKEKAQAFGGKGGGKPELARAKFADSDSIKSFMQEIVI